MTPRALCVLAVAVAAAVAAPARAASAPVSDARAEAVGREVHNYGFPLLEFLRVRREQTSVRCPDRRGNAPVNSFSHAAGFATPAQRTVVAPNTDTLYSIAHLDLRRGPIVLRHPAMGKRYFSFALLDPYTNVIAIPGSRRNGGGAGSIVIRRPGQLRFGSIDRMITTRHRRVWVIGRTLATDAADQRRAQALMRRYRLTRSDGEPVRTFPAGCRPGAPSRHPTPTGGRAFLRALDRALRENPPPERDRPLLRRLARARGSAALLRGIEAEAVALPGAARLQSLWGAQAAKGWLLPPSTIGRYGTDYRHRAVIATVGLGANTPEEAIYPTAITDRTGALLDGSRAYRLTFAPGGAPPAAAFWSLTLYDSAGYLVANPIDRYSLGPSHPPLVKRPDGSIVIAIQSTDPADPTVNWLPSPSPGGFRLSLRLYVPSRAARRGKWRPPGLVRRPASRYLRAG